MASGKQYGGIEPRLPWPDAIRKELPAWVEVNPKRIFLSLAQGSGSAATPVVAVGDRVRIGQLVGEAEEKGSARAHSGVAGKVVEIADREQVSGKKVVTVVIESDGSDEREPPAAAAVDPDADTLQSVACDAGLVGMGGAAFPSHIKLDSDKEIEFCLVNGSECEPLVQADRALMLARAADVVEGARLVMKAMKAKRTLIGIEDNKPDSLALMKKLTNGDDRMIVVTLPSPYPMGGEKQLILYLTGREVPEGKLPSDVGVIVFNVATAAALADAALRGLPLTHRICSVVGDVAKPQNVRFPIGTPVGELIAACGGWTGEPGMVVVGGPMMGTAVKNCDTPLLKSSNAVVAMNSAHVPTGEEHPCIRCNRCSNACPMRLMPQFIDRAQRNDHWKECKRLNTRSCINCGCCTYVCPSRIPLAANITAAGKKLKEMEGKS